MMENFGPRYEPKNMKNQKNNFSKAYRKIGIWNPKLFNWNPGPRTPKVVPGK